MRDDILRLDYDFDDATGYLEELDRSIAALLPTDGEWPAVEEAQKHVRAAIASLNAAYAAMQPEIDSAQADVYREIDRS